ncbi:MAG: flagellin [Proteobacteria bacterium]|nr:flagellin [Pseudomonadota bacterium]
MALTINTNITAMQAQRNLGASSMRSQSALAKLSSGNRITSAKDDAASLSIASGLKLDLASLRAASSNISQASAVLQIADGGLNQISDILGRMQTLASTAQSDQISNTERGFINTEYTNLVSEVTRIANATEYNGIELLSGTTGVGANLAVNAVGTNVEPADGLVAVTFDSNKRAAGEAVTIEYDQNNNVFTVTALDGPGGNPLSVQSLDLDDFGGAIPAGQTVDLNFSDVGVTIRLSDDFDDTAALNANNEITIQAAAAGVQGTSLTFKVGVAATDTIVANINGATATQLGINTSTVSTRTNADAAVTAIDSAQQAINTNRANIGALLSRLDFANANVGVQIENTEAARSTLQDTDVAQEMTRFTSEQVLVQAGVSMLAQANQQPALLLRLLQ